MSYYSSVIGIKRGRSSSSCSSSSSMEFIHHQTQQYHPNIKKQRVVLVDGTVEKKKGVLDVGFSDPISKKAARVEMLKKRFGRIIIKAEEFQVIMTAEDRRLISGGHHHHHHKVESMEMQKKKNQILEKKLKEADEIAAEAESKMELQRKREAARKGLVEVEKNASINEVDDNLRTMKDFATLLGYPNAANSCVNNKGGGGGSWYGLCFSSVSKTSDWRKR